METDAMRASYSAWDHGRISTAEVGNHDTGDLLTQLSEHGLLQEASTLPL
jgi:hypothetical protein